MPLAMRVAIIFLAGLCVGVAAFFLVDRALKRLRSESAMRIGDSPLPTLMADRLGRIIAVNTLLEHLFGYAPGELLGRPLEILLPSVSRARHIRLRREYFSHPVPRPMSQRDLHGLHKRGYRIPIEVGLNAVEWHGAGAVLATIVDTTEKQRWQRELVDAHALLSATIESMPFSVITTELDGTIRAMSPAAERMLGYCRDELIGIHTPEIIHDAAEIQARAAELTELLGHRIEAGFEVFVANPRLGSPESRAWTYLRKDGSRLSVQLTVSAIRNAQRNIVGFLGIAYDITDQKSHDEQLSQLAYYDVLTGLPNRALLEDRFKQSLERAHRFEHRVALMLVDLDRFKGINDSMGHAAGDRVLVAVGERLQACVRSVDTVARIGGDEFVIVLSDILDVGQIQPVADKILSMVSSPIPYSNALLRVTPSIGISLFPDHGNGLDSLLHMADMAMYAVKHTGRGSVRFYDDTPNRKPSNY